MERQSQVQKFEERARQWMSPEGVHFASAEVAQAYRQRVQMLIDIIQLRKPERIPLSISTGFYPFAYAGVTGEEAMYDYERLGYAMKKYHADFLPDTQASAMLYGPGKAFEILDYKLYRWPGHGVPATAPYQCVEAEYMQADEYDRLIDDPTNFFLRTYLPRVFGAIEPWKGLTPFTDIVELPFTGGGVVPFGLPEVQASLRKLMEAGDAALKWAQAGAAIGEEIKGTLGLPSLIGGFSKAPYDTLGDTLRGTKGIMLDKFRQPGKLLAALERLAPLAIEMGTRWATAGGVPVVFIPLHKGADGFLSGPDFQKFYWPTLKQVILGLVREGLVPFMFVEGGYNQRLDVIADPDIPAGTTMWLFDQTDMREVKKRFTGWACFGGNVPVSLLKAGRPEEVRDYVKRLIDDVAGDGGFFLSTGAVLDDAEAENLHALLDAGREYGRYT